MDGINEKSLQGKMLKLIIENFNNHIQKLSEAGLQIHDFDDSEFVADFIYYSPVKDKLYIKFKGAKEEWNITSQHRSMKY